MSRKNKFMIYSKLSKKYIDYITIGFSKTGELQSYSTEIGAGPVLEDHYIVEQGTGLEDKNGKEICEGDIVKYLSYSKEYIGQIVLGFVDDSEGYYVDKHYGWAIRRGGCNSSLGDFADDNMRCKFIEVIGNIHDNAELLGEEDD